MNKVIAFTMNVNLFPSILTNVALGANADVPNLTVTSSVSGLNAWSVASVFVANANNPLTEILFDEFDDDFDDIDDEEWFDDEEFEGDEFDEADIDFEDEEFMDEDLEDEDGWDDDDDWAEDEDYLDEDFDEEADGEDDSDEA